MLNRIYILIHFFTYIYAIQTEIGLSLLHCRFDKHYRLIKIDNSYSITDYKFTYINDPCKI